MKPSPIIHEESKVKNTEKYIVSCPLCEGYMEYTPLYDRKANGTADINAVTHVWLCNDCPGLLMEYYTDIDIERVKRGITAAGPK